MTMSTNGTTLATLLIAITLGPFLAAPGEAVGQVPTLDRADSLLTAGEYAAARAIVDQWWSARDEFDVPGSDRPRALMLRAQLAPDPEAAEPDYLAVVLGYPTSDHAPEALLRLAQGLLAGGEASRAAAYLDRLVADYPGKPQRLPALLWLARANTAARRPAAACAAARSGLQDARDPDLATMLRAEASAACALQTSPAEPASRETRPATTPSPATAGQQPPAATRAAGDWAVQSGAFRYRQTADALMERLRAAGHEPRLVTIPANDLLRVRVGRFTTSEEAGRLLTRLRGQGFDAMVVRDAGLERQP